MDWARLGERVRSERSRRWRRRADLAAATGLSERTIRAVEAAERANFTPDVLAAIEATLGWAPGSVERVLKGQEPRREMDERTVRMCDLWAKLSPDAQRLVLEFAERAIDD